MTRPVVLTGIALGFLAAAWMGASAKAGQLSPLEMERARQLMRERPGAVPAFPSATRPDKVDATPAPAAAASADAAGAARAANAAQPARDPERLESLPELPPSPFEEYVAAAGPKEMSKAVRQFGYDLFRGPPGSFEPVTAVAAGPDYILGPGDEVVVRIWGKAEIEAAAVVDREGKLALPRAGAFPVAGKSLKELRAQIRAEYDKVFVDYQLDVSLGGLKSIGVLVVGNVVKPGRYSLSAMATVVNALIEAGGPTKAGTLRNVKLMRGGKEIAAVDLYELLLSGRCATDIRLQPEDTVFVPPVGARVAVMGGVRVPAIYELAAAEVKLPDLVQMAGGLEATAVTDRVQLERIEGDGRLALSEHSLAAKEPGKLPALKAGDIVRVFQVIRKYGNVVYLQGNVARSGSYEFRPGMKISDLISGPAMLVPEKSWRPGSAPMPLSEGDDTKSSGVVRTPVKKATGQETDGEAEAEAEAASADRPQFPEPCWDYALIRRIRQSDLRVEYVPFDLRAAIIDKDAAEDKPLLSQDTVIIFSKWDFADVPVVQIGGAVNKPGTYPLAPGMRLRDLVSIAGGLKPHAFREKAELHRIHYEAAGQRSERLDAALGEALKGAEAANFELRERDHLFVRSVPEHKEDAVITIKGEVRFPGSYPIGPGEKLSSVIQRAGGYTDLAYLRGAVFLRDSVRKLQQERIDEMLTRLEVELSRSAAAGAATGISSEAIASAREQAEWQQKLLARLRSVKAAGRVVVALGTAEELEGTTQDIALENGDSIDVPSRPGTVNVLGSVYNQTAFLWAKNSTCQHYLKLAGGPTKAADSGSIYVIRADGSVVSQGQGGSSLRWDVEHRRWVSGRLSGTIIEPGDTVIVPENLEKIAWLRETKDITQVLYQVAVAAGVLILAF